MLGLWTLTQFDQCVLNMALIHICDSESHVGQDMRRQYNAWKALTDEAVLNPWLDMHQFTIYLPHPDQEYDGITLDKGLTRGYNVEVEPVYDGSELMYPIPEGGHFVVVLKQHRVNEDFAIAATGIFVRSLAILSLDVIEDIDQAKSQPLIVKHPIVRDYPQDWETKLRLFLKGELRGEALPRVVGHVDRGLNSDYRAPSWHEVSLAANGFLDL